MADVSARASGLLALVALTTERSETYFVIFFRDTLEIFEIETDYVFPRLNFLRNSVALITSGILFTIYSDF